MSFPSQRVAFISALSLSLVLLGAGCVPTTKNEVLPPESINSEPLVEKVQNPRVLVTARDALAFYQKIQDAFDQKTPNLYLSLVRYQDPRDDDTLDVLEKWDDESWREATKDYNLPDISENTLVGFAVSEDQAAYHYALPVDPEQPTYGTPQIQIRSILFVRENGFWKMLDRSEQGSVAVEANPEAQQTSFQDYVDHFFQYNESSWEVYRYFDETHLTHIKFGTNDILAAASGTVMTIPYRESYLMSISEKGIEQIAGQVNISTPGFGYGLGFNSPITATEEQTFTDDVEFPESTRGKELTMKIQLTGESSFDIREVRTIKFRFEE
ncbi:hypothetical protein KBA73_02785 [Patescibacteria group bacterium]|nr:hypothetical protein [Patescibacteria group bacterium]